MRILVLGSGGREHALVWKLHQDGHDVHCAPGNAGIAQIATCVKRDPLDFVGVGDYIQRVGIDLTVVGPEGPLVEGIVDRFASLQLPIFGPTSSAARLEGSKAFAKNLMLECGIPTARFENFADAHLARAYVDDQEYPLVIKASGLALGKGAVIVRTKEEAHAVIEEMLIKRTFGTASETIVIEEYLTGEEASIIGITDGRQVVFLASSQDHKALQDGDQGPNTGGMGAYAPAPVVSPDIQATVESQIFAPLLTALHHKGIEYRGVIYAGIMITQTGPYVLEFNCRFGDPETQVILPLLRSDLGELLLASAQGDLSDWKVENRGYYALCVVAASAGYPGAYEKGRPISGELVGDRDVVVFHAGTKRQDSAVVTSGGRVLGVTGLGTTLVEARKRAYWGLGRIEFEGMHYRRDIGEKGIRRLERSGLRG